MPKGIILMGIENVKTEQKFAIGPVKQTFYFAAVSAEEKVTLEFELTSAACPADVKAAYSVEVQIIPANSEDFVPYSENENVTYGYCCGENEHSKAQIPNEMALNEQSNMKYGYPSSLEDVSKAAIPYGMVFNENSNIKYGYPSSLEDVSKAAIPYGMVFNENSNIKYGYPCSLEDVSKTAMPYGMVFNNNTNMKYGYPGCTGE